MDNINILVTYGNNIATYLDSKIQKYSNDFINTETKYYIEYIEDNDSNTYNKHYTVGYKYIISNKLKLNILEIQNEIVHIFDNMKNKEYRKYNMNINIQDIEISPDDNFVDNNILFIEVDIFIYFLLPTNSIGLLKIEKSIPITITNNKKETNTIYKKTQMIGSGTFGEVYKYLDINTKNTYAIKKMFLYNKKKDNINYSVIRESSILRRLNHINIIPLVGLLLDDKNNIGLIMPLMKYDLYTFINKKYNTWSYLQKTRYAYQVLVGVAYLHSRDILHRDINSNNILYDEHKDNLVIADFGASRALKCPVSDSLTRTIVTLWFRAPELLLYPTHNKLKYSYSVDVWSTTLTIFNILSGSYLIMGNTEEEVIKQIFMIFGTPTIENWPDFSNSPLYDVYKNTKYVGNSKNIINNKIYSRKHINKWINLITSGLVLNKYKRSNIFELLDNELFDIVRNKKIEPARLKCLDNIYLRSFGSTNNLWLPSVTINLNVYDRLESINYLMEKRKQYGYSMGSLFYALHLMDRYLPRSILLDNLEDFLLSCLILSNLLLDVDSYSMSDIIKEEYIVENKNFNKNNIIINIKQLLINTEYDLVKGTGYDFLIEYIKNSDYTNKTEILNLSYYLLLYGYLFENAFRYNPYQQALWSIYTASDILKLDFVYDDIFDTNNVEYEFRSLEELAILYEIDIEDIINLDNITYLYDTISSIKI